MIRAGSCAIPGRRTIWPPNSAGSWTIQRFELGWEKPQGPPSSNASAVKIVFNGFTRCSSRSTRRGAGLITMCGINGIIRFDGMPVAGEMLQAMNIAVCHRGPDDHGVFLHGHVGLGHLRLAVIDLSSNGHQPMCYTHGGRTAVMIYNGEVYNFGELRDELEGKGYAFRSRSDTEVRACGPPRVWRRLCHAVQRMFAFAIYDSSGRSCSARAIDSARSLSSITSTTSGWSSARS